MGNVSSTSIVFITLLGQNPVLRQHRTAAAGGWAFVEKSGKYRGSKLPSKKKTCRAIPFCFR